MVAYIFDLDGVIAITEHIHKKAFEFAFSGYDIDMSKYNWDIDFAGKGHKYIIDTVFGESPANERLIDRWVHYYQIFAHETKPVPGIIEFIKKNSTIPMIIATGSVRRSAELVLDNLNINLPIVAMEDVSLPKPDPALFLLAAERVNAQPHECTVFEDSIYGIRAGKKANMKVIALTTTHSQEVLQKESPDLIVKDFHELISTIEYPQFDER